MHPLRRRRREERGLPLLVGLREDALDVRRESAVEHLVGLVEDEVGDAVEAHRAALQVVEHAARRPNDDLRAAVDRVLLRPEGAAAVDQRRADAGALAERVEHVADLLREFARRDEHEGLEPLVLEVDLLDQGDAEGERLAGAGEGLADDVFAFEQWGMDCDWISVGSSI